MKGINGQKILVIYSGVLTLVVSVAVLSGFTTAATNASFDTITVQRINVVEPDGTLRMVLTNNKKVPAIILNGHEFPDFTGRKKDTTAGILFYDAQASESGGLTFGGKKKPNGTISRFGHLSFDQFDQDQAFAIDQRDDGTNHLTTVTMLDQPSWSIDEFLQLLESIQNLPPDQQEAAKQQFFQEHPETGAVRTVMSNELFPSSPTASRNVLELKDSSGRDRARLRLDNTGTGQLEILDEAGNVSKFPPN